MDGGGRRRRIRRTAIDRPLPDASATYRVVIADDDPSMRQLVRLLLETSGRFQVVAAVPDGREALDAACSLRPDLAVLDLQMPRLDGLQVVRLLRRHRPAIVTVLLSGQPRERFEPMALARGAHGYLEKSSATASGLTDTLLALVGGGQPLPRTVGA